MSIEEIAALAEKIGELKGQLANMVRRCGVGLPPCWVADVSTGRPEYIYNVTIYEDYIDVRAAWPPSRENDVDYIPGARELANKKLSEAEFRRLAQPILDWSNAHECRHFVYITERAITKDSFKNKLLTIEDYFYKYLVREGGGN